MHMHAILWQFECKILCTYKCWCHLSSSGCCLPSWKKKLWIFRDRFAACLSVYMSWQWDFQFFMLFTCNVHQFSSAFVQGIDFMSLFHVYLSVHLLWKFECRLMFAMFGLYFYSLNRLFFWVKWKIQLAINIEVWEFVFGIKRFLME